MNDQIKAVVFDVGGVIRLHEGGDLFAQIADMIGAPLDVFKETYWKYNHLSNVENIPWEDMIAKVVRTLHVDDEGEKRVMEFVRRYEAARVTNKGLISFFPSLHALGLKIGILSNATTALRKWLEDEGIASLVDEIVISAEIGYQKPHKEAFDILFERLKLQPGQVVFVDDSSKSLEKASEIGYIPIRFKDNEQLKIDLQKIGIAVS